MAVAPTRVSLDPQLWSQHVDVFSWGPMGNSTTGGFLGGPAWADRSFQIEGNFAGATVTIQGSNDGQNFHTLHDPFNNLLSFTSAGLAQCTEITLYIQPVVGGGTPVTTQVTITAVVCNHASP